MRLTLAEAILGSKVIVPTLDGDVSLRVPPGPQSGDRRVMTGRGVQLAGHGARGQTGHQYVHFEVTTPRKLSDEQRSLIEAFRDLEPPMDETDRTRRDSS